MVSGREVKDAVPCRLPLMSCGFALLRTRRRVQFFVEREVKRVWRLRLGGMVGAGVEVVIVGAWYGCVVI